MSIAEQIDKDIITAMKAKESERLGALRMVKTALKLRSTELMKPVDDAEAAKVLTTLLKQRRDAAEQFRAGNRAELADKEEREALIIQEYLPAAASEADMAQALAEALAETGATTAKDIGLLMKAARAKLAGKTIDGKVLSDMVKAKLA
jgi:uncharacterized protein YqeY